MESEKLKSMLEMRAKLKKRKPNFVRQDILIKRLKRKWVKPRGLHSKLRLCKKGNAKSVSKGYKSPALVKNMLKNGLTPIYVSNLGDLENFDNKTQTAVINAKVGLRKKLTIVKKAIEMNIKIANLKDPAKLIKDKEDELMSNKKLKQEKQKEKQEKKKKLEDKTKKEEKK